MVHCCRPARDVHRPRIEPEYREQLQGIAERMSFTAAAEHLRRHPELAWQEAHPRDMPAQPWTTFQIQ